jgi:hypothetical protein
MKTLRLTAWVFSLAILLGFAKPASAANSPDGATLVPGGSGSLVTGAGTWTFSTVTGGGGNDILLNGTWVNARAVKLYVANAGQMYSFSSTSHWYHWSGSSFTALSSTPFPISADGSSMTPGGSVDLINSQGIWAFSTSTGGGGNLILLNGASAANGSGVSLLIDNGGQIYTKNNVAHWYVWTGSAWNATADPTGSFTAACASAVVVGLQWSAVSGAATYNISRNGSSIETGTALLAYSDQAVAASTPYTYVLSALNSSGATVSTQNLNVTTPAATPTGDPAFCPSRVIAEMTWNWSTGFNQQDGSDLWSNTWGADGHTYLFFGDGGGFFGTDSLGRASFGIGELTGSAPAAGTAPSITTSNAINVYGGENATHASTINGKANSIIAVGSNFYALGGIWRSGEGGPSGGPNHYEMIYSNGNPYSWQSNFSNWYFCSDGSPGISNTNLLGFCPISFVNFGAGNAGAIDTYVYLLGATTENFIGNGGSCACTYLARVPNNQLLTESAYQVFNGVNAAGVAQWIPWVPSSNITHPIFVDNGPRPMPIGKIVYNSVLKRFIAMGQGGFVNQVAFYDAPNPWGPFTSIGYYNSNLDNSGGWGNLGSTSFTGGHGDSLGINFFNGWTSSNGLTMWATFSSDGTAGSSASLTSLAGQSMDSFSIVSVTLSLP